ncbi:alpha/beta hydrolase [Nocardia yamanashiensis]|uniref:alpha/beta hydrolase n=1 Tax=Nocardia yamanashiensis TaxID=209247 RepID=UPI001E294127|nr:alpha/beta hydrolase [Nocardia yamanashiensis]UGT39515.1 alpha/beta hydrolase [Nocardia yamanashiensis]
MIEEHDGAGRPGRSRATAAKPCALGTRWLRLCLTALLFSAGCGIVGGASDSGLERFYSQHVEWGSCDGFAGAQGLAQWRITCARITVPLDYDDPGGATAQIAVSRAPAWGQRIGSLLTNPGGPGGAGLTRPLLLAPTALAEQFDLIGIDVRGVGASTPKVMCRTAEEFAAERNDADLDYSPAGIAATEQRRKDFVAKCVERTGTEVLSHIGTIETARDMDVIRAALGDKKLTYLGSSYGTRIGSTIAELFPDRVRAMVLDGGIDATADIDDAERRPAAMQRAFDAYAAWCVKSPDCPLGSDPARTTETFRALVNPLREHPAAGVGRTLGYRDAVDAVKVLLYSPVSWQTINAGLRELATGRGDTLLYWADFAATGTADRDMQKVVLCREEHTPTDRAGAVERDRKTRAAAPAFDDGRATGEVPLDACAFWPLPADRLPHTPEISGLPKTVVIAATGDPVAPYNGGIALSEQLGAALITYEDYRHGVVGVGSTCIDETVTHYLTVLTPPPADLRCPAA